MGLRPLVAICGTTGVGKSKLAIELALSLAARRHGFRSARIINADSMQVYAGMDVITNKVPVEERSGVEHLLMGFKRPGEQYIVTEWVRDAMDAIDETHRRGQLPIVVGGTAYWMQNLIFPNRLVSFGQTPRAKSPSAPPAPVSEDLARTMGSLPPELLNLYNALPEHPPSAATDPEAAMALHTLLSSLDPECAKGWHWRDTRKVLRELGIIRENGRTSTAVFAEQARAVVPPRYRTLCFWLYAHTPQLFPRLDARVGQMVEQGLLNEIRELRRIAASSPGAHAPREAEAEDSDTEDSIDYTLGIYQCIGFKEFSDYLSSPTPSEKLFQEALERMKVGTRRYARRQISWIRNQMLPLVHKTNAQSTAQTGSPVTPTYILDASALNEEWVTEVSEKARAIMEAFLDNEPLPDPLTLSDSARNMLLADGAAKERNKVVCQLCSANEEQPVMIEEKFWKAHLGSRQHKRVRRHLMKRSRDPGENPPSRELRARARQLDNAEAILVDSSPLFK